MERPPVLEEFIDRYVKLLNQVFALLRDMLFRTVSEYLSSFCQSKNDSLHGCLSREDINCKVHQNVEYGQYVLQQIAWLHFGYIVNNRHSIR